MVPSLRIVGRGRAGQGDQGRDHREDRQRSHLRHAGMVGPEIHPANSGARTAVGVPIVRQGCQKSPSMVIPRDHWQSALEASGITPPTPWVMEAVTALEWDVDGDSFSITADLSDVLALRGAGVYTVVLWAELGGEPEVVSEYSIFHLGD